jgi:hypothetical protein
VRGAIIGQESGNNPNIAPSSNGAIGPGQIMPATFRQYARPGERIDNPSDNYAVNQRIVQDYQRYNGDASRVAVAYFSGPNNVSPPGSATPWIRDTHDANGKYVSSYVSDIATRLTGGTSSPSNAERANPEALRAAAYRNVMQRDDLDPIERQHAFQYINQVSTAAQVAAEATERAKKEANETASNEYVQALMGNKAGPDVLDKITNDPRLTAATRQHLHELAVNKFGVEDTTQFGSAYTNTYARIFAPVGDKSKITDVNQILKLGLPGGGLTMRGVDRLAKLFVESYKQPDQASINQAKASMMRYVQEAFAKT